MLVITYGQKNYASLAWKEIDGGRPVVLKIPSKNRRFVHKLLSIYAEHDQLFRKGKMRSGAAFSLAWRTLLSPSFIGLCNHARAAGMAVAAYEEGDALEIRFEGSPLAS